ncbi:MAG: 5-formyltetrahydrofolate cyclo-ligase [Halioglobus sp.]
MNSSEQRKTALRKQLRARRLELSPAQQQSCAETVASHLSKAPFWQQAQCLAVYFAADGELDPAALVSLARIAGKSVYLPAIMPNKRLEFRLWEPGTELRDNHFGIPEPRSDGIAHKTPDLICLPLVGWNKRGTRLGMGGGYYDRYLHHAGTTTTVGLAYALQESEQLPQDSWDVALDFVVTEEALISCGS